MAENDVKEIKSDTSKIISIILFTSFKKRKGLKIKFFTKFIGSDNKKIK